MSLQSIAQFYVVDPAADPQTDVGNLALVPLEMPLEVSEMMSGQEGTEHEHGHQWQPRLPHRDFEHQRAGADDPAGGFQLRGGRRGDNARSPRALRAAGGGGRRLRERLHFRLGERRD